MRAVSFAIVAIAASSLMAAATAAAAQADDPSEKRSGTVLDRYETTGEHVSCIHLSELRFNPRHILNDRMILFEGDGNRAYLNVLDSNCPFLEAYGQFRIDTSSTQLCNTDTITVLQRQAGAGTSCGLGKFEVLVKTDKD